MSTPLPLLLPPRDNPWRQLAVSAAIGIFTLTQFLGADAPHQWWVWVLLAINVGLSLVRIVPDDRLSVVALRVNSGASVLAAAGLMAVDPHGVASLFGYFFAGHVGYRRPDYEGVGWAAAMSAAGALALLVGDHAGVIDVPWYVGALTGLPVFVGVANRNRVEAALALQSAAVSAAAAAEATADAATLTERNRIARELHDVLAHSLAGVNLQLEAVDALLEAGATDRARSAVATAQGLVRAGMLEAGSAVRALREDSGPLGDRLRDTVATSAPAGTQLEVRGREQVVAARAADAVHRALQESLTNARKYAPGAAVQIELVFGTLSADAHADGGADTKTGTVTLRVTNHAAPQHVPSLTSGSGLGLLGMRERVREVDGTVRAGPVTGGDAVDGWRVEVTVPVGDPPSPIPGQDSR